MKRAYSSFSVSQSRIRTKKPSDLGATGSSTWVNYPEPVVLSRGNFFRTMDAFPHSSRWSKVCAPDENRERYRMVPGSWFLVPGSWFLVPGVLT
jgi:hypothetical protein